MNHFSVKNTSFAYAATGPLPYTLTNDYLFRALLQQNNKVLKGLICAVLHLSEAEVISVKIENPIELGKALDYKTCILDIKVLLNNHSYINLEMQVVNHSNWVERSLTYLCRTFDNLEKGEDYFHVKPVVQISFLDYTLFPEYPEFYATYLFQNVKNQLVYSDKLKLSVIDLTHIELATEEDKKFHIDRWASLFKSTTWEEIKMLAKNDEYMNEAYESLYLVSKEEDIRLQCEAREDFYRLQRSDERAKRMLEEQLSQANEKIEEKDVQIAKLDFQIQQLHARIKELESR